MLTAAPQMEVLAFSSKTPSNSVPGTWWALKYLLNESSHACIYEWMNEMDGSKEFCFFLVFLSSTYPGLTLSLPGLLETRLGVLPHILQQFSNSKQAHHHCLHNTLSPSYNSTALTPLCLTICQNNETSLSICVVERDTFQKQGT